MNRLIHRGACAWFAVASLIVLSSVAFAQGGTTVDISQWRFLQKAKLIGDAINKHDIDALEAEFDPIVQIDLPPDTLRPLLWNMTGKLGSITKMGEPKIKWKDVVVVAVQFERGILDLQFALDSNNKISGFAFIPHSAELTVPEHNTTALALPFNGQWNVMWGGDKKEQNFHHDTKNQRYAIDVNITDELGKSHTGDGNADTEFFAWGKQILAPAAGIITDVIDGVRDNPPFSGNEYWALGNAVVIKHSNAEYSVLAHLMNHSIKVKVGDTVARGQVLGLCGNSGSSTEPHLQYHMQNTPWMQDATSIKMYFSSLRVRHKSPDVKTEKDYSPIRDDRVSNK